jgi:hypothetical protein
MPIRFYCPFCDQLLGVSSRKAGAVVECPGCHGQVGVPVPGAPPLPLVPVPAPARAAGVVLGPVQVAALTALLVVLTGLAFAAGLFVGWLSGAV